MKVFCIHVDRFNENDNKITREQSFVTAGSIGTVFVVANQYDKDEFCEVVSVDKVCDIVEDLTNTDM